MKILQSLLISLVFICWESVVRDEFKYLSAHLLLYRLTELHFGDEYGTLVPTAFTVYDQFSVNTNNVEMV